MRFPISNINRRSLLLKGEMDTTMA